MCFGWRPTYVELQGLANMLWAYSKLPVSPPEVILVLMGKITEELRSSLRQDHAHLFDAQVRVLS
jgi:hypothetical protein